MAKGKDDEVLARIQRAAAEGSRELDLSNLKLKSLPAPMTIALSGLRVLDLSGNQLQDLPRWVGEIASLDWLDLGNNRFTELPPVVMQLTGLKSLDLSENRLVTLADGIAACGRLMGLHLYRNRLTKLPATIVELVYLESLDASSNQLQSLPPLDVRLARLAILDLRNNRLERLPAGLEKLTGLRVLRLSGNRLKSVDAVGTLLPRLEALDFNNNPLTSLPLELTGYSDWGLSAENNPLGELPPAFSGLGGTLDRRQAEMILREHITGGMQEGTRYFEEVPRHFDSDLALTGQSSVYGLIDLYYKQLGADCQAVLKYPGGDIIDLSSLTRKTAIKITQKHETSLESQPTILSLPGGTGESYTQMYNLAIETMSQLPSVELVPKTRGGGFIPTGDDVRLDRELDELTIRQRDKEGGKLAEPVELSDLMLDFRDDRELNEFKFLPLDKVEGQLAEPEETSELMVNIWLEGAEEPLLLRRPYRVGIDVGEAREMSLVVEPLVEPDWKEEEEVELEIVVTGDDIDVDPPRRRATLHRRKGMEKVYFDVTPLRTPQPEFFVSILLARELFLLQKIRIVLNNVVEEATPVKS